jgi:hypothetical protein
MCNRLVSSSSLGGIRSAELISHNVHNSHYMLGMSNNWRGIRGSATDRVRLHRELALQLSAMVPRFHLCGGAAHMPMLGGTLVPILGLRRHLSR